MISVIRILIPVVTILLSSILLRVVNLKREYRGRQILSLYMSPVISVIMLVVAYSFFDKIDALNQIISAEGDPVYRAGVVIWNAIIVIVFVLVKLILCPIMKKIWADRSRMEATSDMCYTFDEDNSAWFLKPKYRNVRTLFNVLSWVLTFICVVILYLSMAFDDGSSWELKVFPVAALIIVTEIYNFLSGYTKPEYLHSVGGEDIGATRLGAYYRLRKTYETLLPSALLVSHTGNEYAGKEGATELLKRYQQSDDVIEQIVGDYFSRLKKKDGLFDVDLVTMTNTLLHDESAVVFDPFYRDLSEYTIAACSQSCQQQEVFNHCWTKHFA